MTVIRRWECPVHGADFGVASLLNSGRWCQHCGIPASKLVEVEYVPAAQLAGAIEALEEIFDDLEDAPMSSYWPEAHHARQVAEMALERLRGAQ